MAPVVMPSAAGYLLCALLVGGTFMGTPTIAMTAAQRVSHRVRINLIATMTFAFGIGQVAGPLPANVLYARKHSFSGTLSAASGVLMVATLLTIATLRARHDRHPEPVGKPH